MTDVEQQPVQAVLSAREIRRIAVASVIGTTIEWYDFFIYSAAASLVFGHLFFPQVSPASATLVSIATIGVAFVARPVGGIIFGHIGDRVGRKAVLVMTLLIAGLATVLIGVLPTYSAIGATAPVLLVVLRFAQGIGLAGEWGGAVLMAAENAPRNRRGLYAGWPQLGVAFGVILANAVFLILTGSLSGQQFSSWGWRIPFLASVLLIGVGFFVRLKVMESPVFRRLEETGTKAKAPLAIVLRRYPKSLALATLAVVLNLVAFYVLMTFMLSYTTSTLGMPQDDILVGVLVSAAVLAIGTTVASKLSDTIGRKRVIVTLYIAWLIFAFPMFALVNTANAWLVGLALCIGMLLTSAYGPIAAFLAELFPPHVRYSGMSLSFQTGAVIGGAVAPLAAVALANSSMGYSGVAALVLVVAIISICAMLGLRTPDEAAFREVHPHRH
jgi:MFS transporter, MHS family, shikimate and dehydroshikimate transport protein